jgi:FHA domain
MDMDQRSTDVQSTGTIPVTPETLPGAGSSDAPGERPAWVDEARGGLEGAGRWLAYEEDGRERIVALDREWTRIGRSLAADIRFDDATVSRRHALLVSQADGVRVLDDRSLNGVYVNGRRVEWSALRDGDRITVGRHTLWFLDTAGTSAAAPAATAAAGD